MTLCFIALGPLTFEHVWMLALIPPALCVIAALLTVVWRLVRSQYGAAAILGGAIVLVAVLAGPVKRASSTWMIALRFKQMRKDFDVVVLREAAGLPNPGEPRVRYLVERGPPLRVAFPSPGGVGDNWCGVVFDSSRAVMSVNGFGWSDPRLTPFKKLFGGDMFACQHLDGPYYHCCFT